MIADRAALRDAAESTIAQLDQQGDVRLVVVDELGDAEEQISLACVVDSLSKPLSSSDLLDLLMRLSGKDRVDGELNALSKAKAGGRRILLVEDIEPNRILVQEILTPLGYEIVVANNGREAVEIALGKEFDAILMDIQMPEMNGVEATRAIRANRDSLNSSTPIIAVTAHAMMGDRERFLDAGMQAYLSKPLNRDDLVGTLGRVCDRELAAV